MTERTKDVAWLLIVTLLFGLAALLALCCQSQTARADYVVEVTRLTGCIHCDVMRPRVEALQRRGYRIRVVDYDANKTYARQLAVRGVPTFVYVRETATGDFLGPRAVGELTPGQLERFCLTPEVAAANIATRQTLRALLGSPVIVFPGW